jgi:hypothetical protein
VTAALQAGVDGLDPLLAAALRVVGLAALAGLTAGVLSVVFRWYARQRMPSGLATLAGGAVVAAYLNTTGLLSATISGSATALGLPTVVTNLATFAVATGVAVGAGRLGDWLALSAFTNGPRVVDDDLGQIVETVGRVITVSIPDDVGTIEGYDPVDRATLDALEGVRLVFPRGLSVGELGRRLTTRLETEYDVGHVDVELTPEGEVRYLALGSRVAGIGPTLPPRTKAVAVRADPPFSASAGDRVQLWRPVADAAAAEPARYERLLTGEFRARHEDVVTLAVDEADVPAVDPTARYRLVTLPDEPRVDREFAALLRRNPETMGVVEVTADHPLVSRAVGDLGVTAVAVSSPGERVDPVPRGDHVLAAGDTLYALGTPERLRRLSEAEAPAG